jgi:hypothetical protein
MTPQNLVEYVKVYENHLPLDLCASACKNLELSNWSLHEFYNDKTNTSVSYANDLSVSYAEIPEKDDIHKSIWFAIERYIIKDFASFNNWFNGWSGYTQVRFNKYDPSTQMKLHCDHITTMFDGTRRGIPTLTVLGALNDNYDGGEFVMFGDMEIKMRAGSVVVFPSNFMYPHEVKPVKSGVRYSYVSWAW